MLEVYRPTYESRMLLVVTGELKVMLITNRKQTSAIQIATNRDNVL